MNLRTTQNIFGCLIALAIGASLGTWNSGMSRRSTAEQNGSNPTDSSSLSIENSEQMPKVDEEVAHSLKVESGAKRWLILFSKLENATADDMPGLIQLSENDPEMTRMLASRWAELDPHHMFKWLHSDFLLPAGSPVAMPNRSMIASILFEEWTKRDPKAVIKKLSDTPAFPGLEGLRMTAINHLIGSDVETALHTMNAWSIRNFFPDMKQVADWAARDPRHAVEVIIKMNMDFAGQEALKTVARTWAQQDPRGGIAFAATLDPISSATLASEIMRSWAQRDLSSAIKAASTESGLEFRSALAKGLVNTWGSKDPAAALKWSQENLRGEARAEAIGSLIKSAAEKDLRTASDLITGLEPGAALNRACASIFETWFNKGAKERMAAFEWLASIPDESARNNAISEVQWSWAHREPEVVREFITGPYGHLASRSLIDIVARAETSKNPEQAMRWAESLTSDNAKETKKTVLENWLEIRPEGAMDYARSLPNGTERESAIRTVSQLVISRSPNQAAKWYGKLPATEKRIVREVFEKSGLPAAYKQQLEELLRLQ